MNVDRTERDILEALHALVRQEKQAPRHNTFVNCESVRSKTPFGASADQREEFVEWLQALQGKGMVEVKIMGDGCMVTLGPRGYERLLMTEEEFQTRTGSVVSQVTKTFHGAPIDATLTKTQKNALLPLLTKHQFDPADFKWEPVITEESDTFAGAISTNSTRFNASKLVHASTGYYFTFGGYTTVRSPGTTRKLAEDAHKENWQTKLAKFGTWLESLHAEVNAPDLWAAVGQERALSKAGSSGLENTPFTLPERGQIAVRLNELKEHVLTGQQFQADQAEFIEEQFTYLREASERMGRKDWLNVVFAVLIAITVSAAFAPDQAKALLGVAGTLFQWVWSGASTLLP